MNMRYALLLLSLSFTSPAVAMNLLTATAVVAIGATGFWTVPTFIDSIKELPYHEFPKLSGAKNHTFNQELAIHWSDFLNFSRIPLYRWSKPLLWAGVTAGLGAYAASMLRQTTRVNSALGVITGASAVFCAKKAGSHIAKIVQENKSRSSVNLTEPIADKQWNKFGMYTMGSLGLSAACIGLLYQGHK